MRLCFIILALGLFNLLNAQNSTIDFVYHNYENLTNVLKTFATNFPNKTHLYSIGKTVQGITN